MLNYWFKVETGSRGWCEKVCSSSHYEAAILGHAMYVKECVAGALAYRYTDPVKVTQLERGSDVKTYVFSTPVEV